MRQPSNFRVSLLFLLVFFSLAGSGIGMAVRIHREAKLRASKQEFYAFVRSTLDDLLHDNGAHPRSLRLVLMYDLVVDSDELTRGEKAALLEEINVAREEIRAKHKSRLDDGHRWVDVLAL